MPGLLFAQIREKYPEQKQLPVAQLPEEIRRQDPALQILPMMQFVGNNFLVQLGPRVVSLVTKPNAYPGWTAIESELKWLIERLKSAGFVGETERIGARYIDFFDGNIFGALQSVCRSTTSPWPEHKPIWRLFCGVAGWLFGCRSPTEQSSPQRKGRSPAVCLTWMLGPVRRKWTFSATDWPVLQKSTKPSKAFSSAC